MHMPKTGPRRTSSVQNCVTVEFSEGERRWKEKGKEVWKEVWKEKGKEDQGGGGGFIDCL